QRRNELLAKGLCFNCEEAGHLARDCEKVTTVISKKKGKPPGSSVRFGVHAADIGSSSSALYSTTEVLESMPVASMRILESCLEVEEGGESSDDFEHLNFDSKPKIDSPRPIGDIVSRYAEHALEIA